MDHRIISPKFNPSLPCVQLSHLENPGVLEYGQSDEYLAAVEPGVDGGEGVQPVAVRVARRDVDEDQVGGHQEPHPAGDGGAGYPKAEKDTSHSHTFAYFCQVVLTARGLGWINLDIECLSVSLFRSGWARWWNSQILVNPTQVHKLMGHPVPGTGRFP